MIDRKPDRRIDDPEELNYILNKSQILRLGMCGPEGPYVVPMNFGIGDGCLYLHSSPKGKKAAILQNNPNVCFELETDVALIEDDKPCGFSMKFKSIVGYGTLAPIDDPTEKITALQTILAHYTDTPFDPSTFPQKVLAKTHVMRLDITSMTGAKHGWNS